MRTPISPKIKKTHDVIAQNLVQPGTPTPGALQAPGAPAPAAQPPGGPTRAPIEPIPTNPLETAVGLMDGVRANLQRIIEYASAQTIALDQIKSTGATEQFLGSLQSPDQWEELEKESARIADEIVTLLPLKPAGA